MSSQYSVLITHDGVTYDYTKCVCVMRNYPTKTQYISSIATLDFDLAGMDLFGLPLPTRGDYVVFNTATYGEWFTGYVINDAAPTILGADQTGTSRWIYKYQVNSDDYLLNLQSMPVNKVYINTTAGGIIRDLAGTLLPGVFDVQNVQDGPLIGKYVLDPTKKFSDVVSDLAGNAYYRFYAQAKSLYFHPIDDTPQHITIDGNSKFFTPDGFSQLAASTNSVINDCTVLGLVEPQGAMADYFLGDGFTGEFQLTTGLYGLAEETLLDEQFTGAGISNDTWSVYDAVTEYLQVSQGFLNCLGGTGTGAFDVFLQANDPIPLEGTLRVTHGQYDFTQQSDGIIGALYTDLPTAPVSGVFTNCLYGLRVAPGSNGSTNIYPIVDGVVDKSQSLNVNNYTMYNYRYTARTVITYDLQNRTPQQYSYLDSEGNVGTAGTSAPSCNVTYNTFMAVVDPTTGAVQQTVRFTNTAEIAGSTLYAFYTPLISNNLNATVTGITISKPLQASLALKSLEHPTYTVTAPGGDILQSPDQSHFMGQTITAGADWTISGRVVSISNFNTGKQKAGFMVRRSSDTTGTDVFASLMVWADGIASLRYRDTANGNVVEVGQIDQNNGVVDGLTLPQYFKLVKSGTTITAYYSSDDSAYTEYATATVPIDGSGSTVLGMFVTGETWGLAEQITAEFQLVEINGSEITVDTEHDLGYQGLGFDTGFSKSTKSWTSQIIGANELDTLDGLAPVAAIVQQTNSVQKNKNDRGSYEYNPGQCTLEYFSDSTTQTSEVPQQGDLILCRYNRSGTSLSRVVNAEGVASESGAWGDSGHRAAIVSNLTPAPRTSDECAAAATATINSSGWKHYTGTYTQLTTSTDAFGFSGEPLAGAVLPFANMDNAVPGIKQEIIQQVQSTLVSTSTQEVFAHQIQFGPIDTAQEFVNRLNQPQGVVVPNDTAYIPKAVDLQAYSQAVLPPITNLQYNSVDVNSFHFQVNDTLNAGENIEIRSSDDSWGCDAGKNLIARIANGNPQTFSTVRTPNGRIAFVRRYDTRNLIPYSEDLTKWQVTAGLTVANSRQVDSDASLTQVSSITVTQPGKVFVTLPLTASSGSNMASMLHIKGVVGSTITAGVYNDSTNWQVVGGSDTVVLTDGWALVKVGGTATQSLTTVTFAVIFTQAGVYQITHAQLELNSTSTVYCRTNGSPYGALSRYSAGVRAQLPMIPPAPTGSVDTTDPVNPVITLTLPAVLTDVWGFEIRDSDNKTVLDQAQFGQTGFGQGFDMKYTVAANDLLSRSFYLYTFNLLNEYSTAFVISMNSSHLVAGLTSLTIEDDATTVQVNSDGTTTPRLLVSWSKPTDPYVLNGGKVEVQYQFATLSTEANGGAAPAQPSLLSPQQQSDGVWLSAWVDAGSASPQSTSMFIGGVTPEQYASVIVRARTVRADGVTSEWLETESQSLLAAVPEQVSNVSAVESPYMTAVGMQSIVAVAFTPPSDDPYYSSALVYFTGYNGNSNPQLMGEGSVSPIQFLCDTTHEVVTVTVVSINANSVQAPFMDAPTTVVALDGVQSAPPAPSISEAQTALPGSGGWQFTFNVIGGLEAAAGLVSGYRVYHSQSQTPPSPPNGQYTAYPQPATNTGQIVVQETTQDILYYWVSSYNSAGFESPLTAVPFVYVDPGSPAPDPTPVQTTKNYAPVTYLNGWAANAHAGNYEGGSGLGSEVWGTNGTTTLAYSNAISAYDGNQSTAAASSQSHTHSYSGCIWSFSNFALAAGASTVSAQISIVSEVLPTSGGVAGHADIWYTLDDGTTWTKLYGSYSTRLKQTDVITLDPSQDLTKVQVMAFMDSHDDIAHKVYEITAIVTQSAPGGGPETVTGVTATLVGGDIKISWNSLMPLTRTDVVSYEVTRATHGVTYTQSQVQTTIAWSGAATYSWVDPEGHDGSFDYWVVANNATGASEASGVVNLASATSLIYADGQTLESLQPAEGGADVTGSHTAADAAALNGVLSHLISPISTLMPAEAGADVTGSHTAADTSAVNGVSASSISPISGLMPSEAGADVTATHTAADTTKVNGVASNLISPISGLMPAEAGADVTATHTSADTAKVNGIASASISPISALMPAEAGANVTANHVLTTTATADTSGGPTSLVQNTITAIPGLVWSVQTSGTGDVYNVQGQCQFSVQTGDTGGVVTLSIGIDGNTTTLYGFGSVDVSTSPNNLMFGMLLASITGLAAGTHTLQVYATSAGVGVQSGSGFGICQRIF